MPNDDGYFGGDVAKTYDAVHGGSDTAQVRAMVDVLHDFAAGGSALEFAIGTGRVALPLQEKGVDVKGIELSQAMVDELRRKPGGDTIEVALGDMTTTKVAGEFSLVFLVFNTIDNVTSQDAQLACFKNAFAHLAPGGRFAIETLVPPIQRLPFGETKLANDCSPDHWGIDEFDIVTQQYSSHHLWPAGNTHRRVSIPFRYAWPAEFDLMAKWAGFEVEDRWADWSKAPFTRHSKSHVSVWRKPSSAP